MTESPPEELLSLGEQRVRYLVRADPAAAELMDVLFRRHYAELLRLSVVVLGSREAAEDAVQDAFVGLHRHLRSLRDPDAAAAYLRSAVLNRCRSWMRRQVTQRVPRPLMLVRDRQESSEDTVIGREESDSLVAAMRTLARRQRQVLACRYVLELSVAETAELLDMSEGSVKAHTHRALRALEQRIEVAR
jgi:RNA polymerase sigma factor (sigma-70 family)